MLIEHLRKSYDFIVFAAGSSGSIAARRLAEDPNASVQLIEAGGSDDLPSVMDPAVRSTNLGSTCDADVDVQGAGLRLEH